MTKCPFLPKRILSLNLLAKSFLEVSDDESDEKQRRAYYERMNHSKMKQEKVHYFGFSIISHEMETMTIIKGQKRPRIYFLCT